MPGKTAALTAATVSCYTVVLLSLESVHIASGREIVNCCFGCWGIKLLGIKELEEEEVERS